MFLIIYSSATWLLADDSILPYVEAIEMPKTERYYFCNKLKCEYLICNIASTCKK